MMFKMNGGELEDMIDGASVTYNDEGVIKFKDDRWMLKAVDESNVLMFAALVPAGAMDQYDHGGVEEIGVRFEKITAAIGSSTDPVEVELDAGAGTHKLHVRQGGYDAGVGLLNPDTITGVANNAPDVPHAVEIEGDISFIDEFAGRLDGMIGSSSFLISAREDGIYLYGEGDTDDLLKYVGWDQFDNWSIDWSVAQYSENNGIDPEEEKQVNTTISMDYIKSMDFLKDEGRLSLGNDVPCRFVFEYDSGVMGSFFLAPRLPSESTRTRIPEDAIEQN